MTSPVNPWPGPNKIAGPFARQFINALWAEVSAAGDIEADDTVEVYGVTYTCVSVGTGSYGQVTLTDPNGFAWSVPNYASPIAAFTNVTNYNAAENSGS